MKTSTDQECLLLITASLLLQAADRAPSGFRKRLQSRAEEMLDEADALDAPEDTQRGEGLRFDADLDIEIDEPAS